MKTFLKKILNHFLQSSEIRKHVTVSGHSKGLQNVTFEGKNALQNGCNFSGKISVGYATTLGYNNFFAGDIQIGKYCQFGSNVAIHTTNHPIYYLSTYINKNLFKGELASLKTNQKTIIGNDVWVGQNVIILGGISIGNGAILAAGAIVTKDVAPFSVVVGNPAHEIKKRFSDKICCEIQQLAWWNLSESELEKIKPLFLKNLSNANSIFENQ